MPYCFVYLILANLFNIFNIQKCYQDQALDRNTWHFFQNPFDFGAAPGTKKNKKSATAMALVSEKKGIPDIALVLFCKFMNSISALALKNWARKFQAERQIKLLVMIWSVLVYELSFAYSVCQMRNKDWLVQFGYSLVTQVWLQ